MNLENKYMDELHKDIIESGDYWPHQPTENDLIEQAKNMDGE